MKYRPHKQYRYYMVEIHHHNAKSIIPQTIHFISKSFKKEEEALNYIQQLIDVITPIASSDEQTQKAIKEGNLWFKLSGDKMWENAPSATRRFDLKNTYVSIVLSRWRTTNVTINQLKKDILEADASLEDSSTPYKKRNKKSQKEPERKWG